MPISTLYTVMEVHQSGIPGGCCNYVLQKKITTNISMEHQKLASTLRKANRQLSKPGCLNNLHPG